MFDFYRVQVNYLRSVVVLVKMRHSTERNYLQSNYAGRAELASSPLWDKSRDTWYGESQSREV